jgi:hypothetical protein
MRFGLAVDELNGDPDPIARFADASFRDVVDPELARDLALTGFPLWTNTALREITSSSRKRESSVMMSSVSPSTKNSCSGSPLILSNGKTAIEGFLTLTGGACEGSEAT